MKEITINAEGLVLGRMATLAAKQALLGNSVTILNSEKVIVSGDKKAILKKFQKNIQRGTPGKGPFFPRRPDRIVKRVIRGMLPYKKPKGRDALSSVKCYIGVPDEFKDVKSIELSKKAPIKYVSLSDICKLL